MQAGNVGGGLAGWGMLCTLHACMQARQCHIQLRHQMLSEVYLQGLGAPPPSQLSHPTPPHPTNSKWEKPGLQVGPAVSQSAGKQRYTKERKGSPIFHCFIYIIWFCWTKTYNFAGFIELLLEEVFASCCAVPNGSAYTNSPCIPSPPTLSCQSTAGVLSAWMVSTWGKVCKHKALWPAEMTFFFMLTKEWIQRVPGTLLTIEQNFKSKVTKKGEGHTNINHDSGNESGDKQVGPSHWWNSYWRYCASDHVHLWPIAAAYASALESLWREP